MSEKTIPYNTCEYQRELALEIAAMCSIFHLTEKYSSHPNDFLAAVKIFLDDPKVFSDAAFYLNHGVIDCSEIPSIESCADHACLPQSAVKALRQKIKDYGFKKPLPPKNIRRFTGVGKIYLGKAANHGLTKIGFSKCPTKREETLQGEDPHFEFLFVSGALWSRKKEKQLHNKYADLRVRGEWFRLSQEQIEEIKKEINESEVLL